MIVSDNFTTIYRELVDKIYNKFDYESAPRGQKVRESLAVQFKLTNPRNRFVAEPQREFPLTYVIAESLWYMLGNNQTEWISNYSSFWKNISDDGVTANSAYGARIFRKHPTVANGRLNQWEYVKEELTRDRDSRRAVILIRTPDDSIDAKLDVPCTLSLQFFVRDNKLELVVTMRSTDLVLGLTNDVPAFCLFQEIMAYQLGYELGSYTHVSNSLHIYEKHFDMCKKILESPQPEVPKPLPEFKILTDFISLDRFQELARSVTTISGLKDLEKRIYDEILLGFEDQYWIDWGYLLLAHRAGKLGDPKYKQQLINSTSFDGYHKFTK